MGRMPVLSIGGSKGALGTRPLPGGQNSFIFMQFLAKNLRVVAPSGKSWIRHCLAMPANGNVSAKIS